MSKSFKRLGSFLLALMMVLSLVPFNVLADEAAAEEGGVALIANGNVAKVGDTEYDTLAKAIDAAVDGDTVTLLTDITGADVTISKAITLDLGDKTITDAWIKTMANVTIQNGAIKNTSEPYPLVVKSGALTIENVAIEASKSDRAIWLDGSTAVLNFNSGSILATKGENNTKSKIYGVWVSQGATANINGGTITVDAGADATAVAIFGNYVNTVNINGGKISTSGKTFSYAVYTNGAVTVSGGEIVTNEKKYGYDSGITFGKNYAIYTTGDVEIAGGKITTNGPSGYLVNAGGSNQKVTISDVEFTNVLSETDKTVGNHSEPNLIYGSSVTAEITGGEFNGVSAQLIKGTGSDLTVSGGSFSAIDEAYVKTGSTVTVAGQEMVKTEDGLEETPDPVAQIGETKYTSLQEALNAAAAGSGNVTVEILEDINLTGTDWTPVTVSAPGYPLVTVNGNNKTITGLNDMLFAGTWAGKSGLIINDLTIADSIIVNDENDSQGTVGVGAFIGYPQASETITLKNCHLKNSTVKGGHWTGGLIGMAGGYNGNDGPVFMNLTITGCSVTGSTITGKGSAGGVIGHGSCAAWTNVVIKDTTVSGNTITSTGSSANKAGSVMGTIGAAGQATTANGETKTGGASVAVTTSGNTVKSAGTTITTIYGRQGTETGKLTVTGGTYEAYPIEENVSYAAPAKGYVIEESNGTYGVVVDPAYGKAAKIGDTYFETLAEAVAAAKAGDEIVVLADVAEDVTVPAGVIFNGNGKKVGAITAAGEITFKGVTKAASFSVVYTNTTINIGEGACLEITGAGRMVIGHGCTFNITGTITNAKTADKATVQPSLIMPGASFTGAGVTFNVKNAYIKAPSSYCSSSKSASGTFDFNIENSIWESAGKLAFEAQSTAATVNFELKDSVLNTGSHLVFGVSKGEVVIDNSNVNVGKSNQIENRSTMTIKNGSVVNGAVATSSNAKNPGTLIVENATYAVSGEFSGSDLGTGTLIVKSGASFTAGSVTKANIVVDATGMKAGDEVNINADLAKHTGTLEVVNNDALEASIVDGKIVLAAKPVAQIGTTKYETLVDAFKAATEGCTIEILSNVTISEKWDCRDYATNGSHSQFKESVTINGNGHIIKFTGTISDSNWNTIFRFEENAVVNNLTVDISEATGAQRVITAKKSLTVDGLTIIGGAKYGVIFGEGSTAADLAAAEIVVKNSTLTGTRRAISDNEGAKDVKSVVITDNTLNANVYVSASESIVFNNNTTAGEVDLRSYAADNTLSVEAKGNTLTTTAKNYIYAKTIDAQAEFTTARPAFKVATKAELDAALAAAAEGDTIVLTADIDYGTTQLKIEEAITLDLGGKTLTTGFSHGGIALKGGCSVKNGTINHKGTVSAIKAWDVVALEDLTIDVAFKAEGKVIGGIVIQENAAGIDTIKNVTIKGDGLTNGIETNNCGNATEDVIGSMENVTIDAVGTGMLISAPCGTATGCSIKGGTNGIEIWIKGTYSASLDLVNSKVEGGVYAHDEFSSDSSIVNNGTLSLTADAATTGAAAEDVTLTLARAENIEGVLEDVKENAQAKVNDTYYATIAKAMDAAQPGDTVTILAGDYTMTLNVNKAITVMGEGEVNITGKLNITADGATVKNLNVNNGGSTAGYISAKDVLVEGCTVVGGNGFRYCYTTGTVTFRDSTITGSTYGIHFDGSAGGNIVIDNCTITGWTSFAGAINNVVIEDTTFAEGYYNVLRFYQNAQLTNVKFNPDMTIDFGKDEVKAEFNGCSVTDGSPLTDVIYLPDTVEMGVDVIIDNTPVVVEAMIGDTCYLKLADAMDAAQPGEIVTILAGDYTMTLNVNKAITVVGEGEVNINGKLNITADGATVKNLNVNNGGSTAGYISAKDVLVEGCTVVGGNGFRYCYTTGTVTFKDSTITGSTYGIHFDGSAGGNIVIDNCVITGWTSFAGTIDKVAINDTTFAEGNYNYVRFYQKEVVIDGCTFNEKMTVDLAVDAAGVTVTDTTVENNGSVEDLFYGNDIANSTITVDGTKLVRVAKIGNTYYTTLAEALTAAQSGDTVTLLVDTTMQTAYDLKDMVLTIDGTAKLTFNDKLTVHGETTLNISCPTADQVLLGDGAILKDSTINGDVFVFGGVTFRGKNTVNMVYDFGTLTGYYGAEAPMAWTVEKGGSLTIVNKARYGFGYGDNVTIYGSLTDALTAREGLTKEDASLFTHGMVAQESTGWNCSNSMTVKDAYVIIGSNNSFGNKPGNYGGNYTFNFENVVLDGSRITFYEAPSVTEFNFDGSDIKIGTFMTRDADSVFTLTDSVLLSTTTTNGTDEGNYNAGTLVLVNSKLTYSAPVVNTGVMQLDLSSSITAPTLTGTGKIVVDASNFNGTSVKLLNLDEATDMQIEIINNTDAKIEITADGVYVVACNYVAQVGETKYESLQAAIDAAGEGDTVTLLTDVTITTPAYGQNALNHARAVSFTLDLNGKTLSANTGNSVFRFNISQSGATSDVTVTIKNGKVVAGANTWCALMAAGISADVKAVLNLEDLTVEASKAGDLAIKAWDNGLINAKNVTVNATNGAGGFYAVGGEIVLDDCTVNQKGLHTAPYLSMAIAVSSSGKMTVNSGIYSAEPTSAAEGNNQGTSHGSWVAGVMNSGGTLIINGGTFSNGNYGDDALATAARGLIFADTNGIVEVNGGIFNALKSVFDFQNNLGATSPVITVKGGTYSADPAVVTSYGSIVIPAGLGVEKNADGTYSIVTVLKGSGTAEDPYMINSVEDLILFRDSVNAGETKYSAPGVYVALGANIDLAGINWEPIGNVGYTNKYVPTDSTKVFSGIFDGNGKVIYNLTISKTVGGADEEANLGLFGITGKATIKNLTLTNVAITTDGRNVGALAGFACMATLENITVNGDIKIEGGNNVSGVCGMTRYNAMSATNITLKGNNGSYINGNNIVGGIFAEIAPNGSAQTFKGLSIENVAISGKGGVGGIVGLLTVGTVEDVTVKNVTLTGNTLYQGDAMGRIRLGSVAGLMGGTKATIADATVENVTATNLDGTAVKLPIIGANYDSSSNATEAKIGDTYYATFAAAYNAAETGETIELLAPVVVAKGKTLTLDKAVNITYTSNAVGEDMFTVRGTLNIAAGTITYTNTDKTGNNVTVSTISCEPGSVLNVTGGTIENKTVYSTGSYAYAIDLLTNGNLGDVTVTISGGKVYSDYMAIRQFNNGTACKNTLTVSGGEIYGAKRAIQIHLDNNAAYLNISGGKIDAGEGGYALCLFPTTATNIAVAGGTFTGSVYSAATEGFISGGTFSEAPEAAYVAEGFVALKKSNGTYGIEEAHFVASNGTTTKNYATLQEAITACPKYYTVTLHEDYDGEALVVGTNNKATTDGITIDLNGYKLNADITVNSPSDKFTLTLKDSKAGTTEAGALIGNITANDNVNLTGVAMTGTATVTGGTFTLKNNAKITGNVVVSGTGALKGAVVTGETANVIGDNASITAAAYVLDYNRATYGYYGSMATAEEAAAQYKGYSAVALNAPVTPAATVVATYNGKDFTNLQDAANATLKYKVLTLKAVNVAELNIKQSITIDLNGCDLKDVTITVESGKTLTIKGTGTMTNVTIEGSAMLNGATITGDVTVKNGTLTVKTNSTVTKVTVGEGGVLKGTYAGPAFKNYNGETFTGITEVNAAACVWNYGSAKITSYFGTLDAAKAEAAKYRGYSAKELG